MSATKNVAAKSTHHFSPLAPGREVVVTEGLAKGSRGKLVQLSVHRFGDQPVWAVSIASPSGFSHLRCIRADYLEVLS